MKIDKFIDEFNQLEQQNKAKYLANLQKKADAGGIQLSTAFYTQSANLLSTAFYQLRRQNPFQSLPFEGRTDAFPG